MRPILYLSLAGCLCWLTTAPAAEPGFDDRARDFANDRVRDVRSLVNGPELPPSPAIDGNIGCIELYQRRVQLERERYDRNPPYWDDPRNQASVFLGTIWTPAFYFLGYSAVTDQLEANTAGEPQGEIDALRQASAALRCFEK